MAAQSRVLLILVAALLAACGSLGVKNRASILDDNLRAYSKLLRWGEYEQAANYIARRDHEAEPIDFGKLAGIRVTAYRELERILTEDAKEAHIRVKIEFYHEDTGVVHTLEDTQTWWYEPDAERWFLDSPLPDFSKVTQR